MKTTAASSIMQSSVLLLFGTTFVLLMLVQEGSAIRCFECNSYNDTRCAQDIPPQELSVECSNLHKPRTGKAYTLCRKVRQIIEFSVNHLPAETRYIRTCAWDDSTYKNACYKRSGFGSRQDVCACDTDNCNKAGTVHASLAGLAAMLAAAYVVRM